MPTGLSWDAWSPDGGLEVRLPRDGHPSAAEATIAAAFTERGARLHEGALTGTLAQFTAALTDVPAAVAVEGTQQIAERCDDTLTDDLLYALPPRTFPSITIAATGDADLFARLVAAADDPETVVADGYFGALMCDISPMVAMLTVGEEPTPAIEHFEWAELRNDYRLEHSWLALLGIDPAPWDHDALDLRASAIVRWHTNGFDHIDAMVWLNSVSENPSTCAAWRDANFAVAEIIELLEHTPDHDLTAGDAIAARALVNDGASFPEEVAGWLMCTVGPPVVWRDAGFTPSEAAGYSQLVDVYDGPQPEAARLARKFADANIHPVDTAGWVEANIDDPTEAVEWRDAFGPDAYYPERGAAVLADIHRLTAATMVSRFGQPLPPEAFALVAAGAPLNVTERLLADGWAARPKADWPQVLVAVGLNPDVILPVRLERLSDVYEPF